MSSKHTSSQSLGVTLTTLAVSKKQCFKTSGPVLTAYPDQTCRWMIHISEFLSLLISLSFSKGDHWDTVCQTSEVLHQDSNEETTHGGRGGGWGQREDGTVCLHTIQCAPFESLLSCRRLPRILSEDNQSRAQILTLFISSYLLFPLTEE